MSLNCCGATIFCFTRGRRSYSGELKPPKTGLLHAALTSEMPGLMIVPTAIACDLVLEDHILARQRVKRRQRPFAREFAEMVRYAVGIPSAGVRDVWPADSAQRMGARVAPRCDGLGS